MALARASWARGLLFLTGGSGLEPVEPAAGLDDQRIEGQPVHDGGARRVSAGSLRLLPKGLIGDDRDGGLPCVQSRLHAAVRRLGLSKVQVAKLYQLLDHRTADQPARAVA